MATVAPPPSPPWRFRLVFITGLGLAANLWLIGGSAVARTREVQVRGRLLAELRRFAEAQEDFLSRTGSYATEIAPADAPGLHFTPAADVVLRFEAVDRESWHVVVRPVSEGALSCGIFRGSQTAAPHRAVVTAGAPACW